MARIGQILDVSKTKAGQTLDLSHFYGQTVDKVWTLRKFGQTLDKLWTNFGQSLDIASRFCPTHHSTPAPIRLRGQNWFRQIIIALSAAHNTEVGMKGRAAAKMAAAFATAKSSGRLVARRRRRTPLLRRKAENRRRCGRPGAK